ncbi:MAG: class I adenylate-forming enzyme family protein [Myxococcota bacterium]
MFEDVERKGGVPQLTRRHFDEDFADRHLLHGVITRWAQETPDKPAIIDAETDKAWTFAEFDRTTTAMALKLLDMGYEKGDFLATSLPLLPEHIFLEYACFKIGVVMAPLDLRLKGPEVIRSLGLIEPKGFAFLGETPVADFSELGRAVQQSCPYIRDFIQFVPPGEEIEGAVSAFSVAADAERLAKEAMADPAGSALLARFQEITGSIDERDGALVIYTTGSTGFPKPALLSHRNATCQNMCLGAAFGMDDRSRMLVNLPPSHVGCQTEQMMTPFFYGGTAVILHIFDAEKSLKAIEDYRVTDFGQIPALFNLQWRLPNYEDFDLSSLNFALYGGQQVSRPFLEKLQEMCPRFGTGLGLTEMAGFVTYTPLNGTVDDILASVGQDMPVTPMTIRAPMNEDGTAGDVLPDGEVGEVCFEGPQVFLGYVNNDEATAKSISKEGVLYTGDLGSRTEAGLQFAGRSKLVIKPKGYQVFPAQVEEHFADLEEKVASVGVVGVKHEVFSEGIVAFVEKKPGADLSHDELHEHARGIASYMRPLHYVVLDHGEFPLNRVSKTDYVTLKEQARDEVEALRRQGGWDQG